MENIKKIIHVDMDYFYAQVEEVENKNLKYIPVGIGGLYGDRGVLCTCNYIARSYGIHSAISTLKALKLCPELTLITPNFKKYKAVSDKVFKVFYKFTNKVQALSLDEAYLDVTDCDLFNNDAVMIAKEIKKLIFIETGLTASAGVSYNKLLSKIGSELFKPDGLAVLRPQDIENKIKHFPVSRISGVGKVTQKRMSKLGIKTFENLQCFSKLDLVNLFGNFGPTLYHYCRGVDQREVRTDRERKSVSVERTFREDLFNYEKILFHFKTEYMELSERLISHSDKSIKSLFVKIKFFDFSICSIEKKGQASFENFEKIFNEKVRNSEKPIRLIGLGVRFHSRKCEEQLMLPMAL